MLLKPAPPGPGQKPSKIYVETQQMLARVKELQEMTKKKAKLLGKKKAKKPDAVMRVSESTEKLLFKRIDQLEAENGSDGLSNAVAIMLEDKGDGPPRLDPATGAPLSTAQMLLTGELPGKAPGSPGKVGFRFRPHHCAAAGNSQSSRGSRRTRRKARPRPPFDTLHPSYANGLLGSPWDRVLGRSAAPRQGRLRLPHRAEPLCRTRRPGGGGRQTTPSSRPRP